MEGKKLINANFLTDLDDAKIPNNDIVEVSEVSQNKEKETRDKRNINNQTNITKKKGTIGYDCYTFSHNSLLT